MLLNAANNTAAAAPQYLARSHDSCFFHLESFFTPSSFPISYLSNVCFDVLPAFRSVVSMPPKRSSPKGRPNRAKFKCIRCDKVVNGDLTNEISTEIKSTVEIQVSSMKYIAGIINSRS